jgi:hypothetical protein
VNQHLLLVLSPSWVSNERAQLIYLTWEMINLNERPSFNLKDGIFIMFSSKPNQKRKEKKKKRKKRVLPWFQCRCYHTQGIILTSLFSFGWLLNKKWY